MSPEQAISHRCGKSGVEQEAPMCVLVQSVCVCKAGGRPSSSPREGGDKRQTEQERERQRKDEILRISLLENQAWATSEAEDSTAGII